MMSTKTLSPNLKPIIVYKESGYFGDSDLLTQMLKLEDENGRDMTAYSDTDCTIFVMSMSEIVKIKQDFRDEFK